MRKNRPKLDRCGLIQLNVLPSRIGPKRLRQRINGGPNRGGIKSRNAGEYPGILWLIQEGINTRASSFCGSFGAAQAFPSRPELRIERGRDVNNAEGTRCPAWVDATVNP